MNKVIDYIKSIIKWIWQFPQNILALSLEGILCETAYREGKVNGKIIVLNTIMSSPLSLGDYIFISSWSSPKDIRHEFGHSRQSTILGPLYLIVITIPSILHKMVHSICKRIGINWNYHRFYTELWANRLGNI